MDQTVDLSGLVEDTGQENDAQQLFTLLYTTQWSTVVDVRKNTTVASRIQSLDGQKGPADYASTPTTTN